MNYKNTNTVAVSYEISITNKAEYESVKDILEQAGNCLGVGCDDCPFSRFSNYCVEPILKQRLKIVKILLGEEK